jgi:Zn-dependent protease with chaperone function
MFPTLQIIIAVLVGELASVVAAPLRHPSGTPVATLFLALIPYPFGVELVRRLRDLLARRKEIPWEQTLRFYGWAVGGYRNLPLMAYAVACLVFGWPSWVEETWLGGIAGVRQLAKFLPFLVALALSWLHTWRVDRLFRLREAGFREYFGFQARQAALPLVPLLLVSIGLEALEQIPVLQLYLGSFRYLQALALFAVFSLVFLLSPMLLRLVFGGKPLPDGPLKSRLLRFGASLGFHPRRILVWHTRLHLLNAAVVGVVPGLQYVFLTDGLLESCTEDEIEAVYAHEVGHARRRHLLFYFVFSLGSVLVLLGLERLVRGFEPYLLSRETIGLVLTVPVFFVYWFLYLGFLSRRIERDADLFGARAVGAQRFADTLEAIAWRSGNVRNLRSWRHGSIAERAAFVHRVALDPGAAARATRSLARAVAAFFALFAASAAWAFWDVREDHEAGRLRVALAALPGDLDVDRLEALHGSVRAAPDAARAVLVSLQERGARAEVLAGASGTEEARRAATVEALRVHAWASLLQAELLVEERPDTAARLYRRAWLLLDRPRAVRIHMHRLGLLPGE